MYIDPPALMLLMMLLGIFIGIIGTLAYQTTSSSKLDTTNEFSLIPPGSYVYKDGKIRLVEEMVSFDD